MSSLLSNGAPGVDEGYRGFDPLPLGSDGDVRPTLEALPGIESEPHHPPEPSNITVETMADVIAGYDALEQELTEVWRCEIGR